MKTTFQKTTKRLIPSNSERIAISDRSYRLILFLLFGWYFFQMLYFALSIRPGISPDEMYHIELSRLHAERNAIRLSDSPETYHYGSVSTQAYLYHLAMGKLLLVNVFDFNDVLYLRFFNIAFSLITLWILLLLMREITPNRLIHFALLVVATNILMFVFRSAMVSYDNLTNLFAAASFLYLVRYYKHSHITDLLLLMLVLGAGSLVKYALLPLVIIHALTVVYIFIKGWIKRHRVLRGRFSVRELLLAVAVAFFIVANYNLYGRNLIEFNNLKPPPDNVIGLKNARENPSMFHLYNQMRRNAALHDRYSFGGFTIRYYFRTIENTFGISAHKTLARPARDQLFHQLLLLAMIVAAVANYKHLPLKEMLTILLIASIAYFLVAFAKNYKTYSNLAVFGAALHGRYNFPVLAPFLVFLTFSSLYRLPDFKKLTVLFILTPLLAWQSFFWFLARVNEDWFWV